MRQIFFSNGGASSGGGGGGGGGGNLVTEPMTLSVPSQYPTIQAAFDHLSGFRLAAPVTISVAAGVHAQAATAVCEHPDQGMITVRGAAPVVTTTVASNIGIYSSSSPYTDDGVYEYRIQVASSAGFEVGGYAIVDVPASGLSFYNNQNAWLAGVWRVSAVPDSTHVWLVSSTQNASTGEALAGSNVSYLPTVVSCTDGGIEARGTGTLTVRDIVFVGSGLTTTSGLKAVGNASTIMCGGDDMSVGVRGFGSGLHATDGGAVVGAAAGSKCRYGGLAERGGDLRLELHGVGCEYCGARITDRGQATLSGVLGGNGFWSLQLDAMSSADARQSWLDGNRGSSYVAEAYNGSFMYLSASRSINGSYSPGIDSSGNYNAFIRRA